MARSATVFSIGSLTERYNLTFQALPWRKRASAMPRIDRLACVDLFDRSLSFKADRSGERRLHPQCRHWLSGHSGPDLPAGYIVATKSLRQCRGYARLGWALGTVGTFGNPFTLLSQFVSRRVRGHRFAKHGRSASTVFPRPRHRSFGVSSGTPGFHDVSVIAEFSGDRYARSKRSKPSNWRTPFNFGLSYRPFEGVEVGRRLFYGHLGPGGPSARRQSIRRSVPGRLQRAGTERRVEIPEERATRGLGRANERAGNAARRAG